MRKMSPTSYGPPLAMNEFMQFAPSLANPTAELVYSDPEKPLTQVLQTVTGSSEETR